MKQATAKPTRKVGAAGIAGAIAAIIVWIVGEFAGIDVPTGVEAALATVVAFVAGYFVEDEPNFDHRLTQ